MYLLNIMRNKTVWSVAVIMFCYLPLEGNARLRFRPRIYLGSGFERVIDEAIPVITIEDDYDKTYYDWNLASPKRSFFQLQTRLNIFEYGNFSIGYIFWSQHHEYPVDFPNSLIKVEKAFPHSYDYSMHGITLQWNAAHKYISSKWFVPYIIGGIGKFFGSFKNFRYEFLDTENGQSEEATKVIFKTDEYDGWVMVFGLGATVFKYVYFYVGFLDLRQDILPAKRFIDVLIGVTI